MVLVGNAKPRISEGGVVKSVRSSKVIATDAVLAADLLGSA
jgi:hypothetical protein